MSTCKTIEIAINGTRNAGYTLSKSSTMHNNGNKFADLNEHLLKSKIESEFVQRVILKIDSKNLVSGITDSLTKLSSLRIGPFGFE